RVGFVSAHFRWHSVGRLTIGLLERLCTRRGLEVFVIDASSDGGHRSTAGQPTATTAQDTSRGEPDEDFTAREAIATLQLDVLVYADVGMDAFTTGLAHGRLSPVQVAFWGHPGTTGLSTMDYFISSDLFEGELGAGWGDRKLRSDDGGASSVDDDTRHVGHREEAGRNPDVRDEATAVGGDEPVAWSGAERRDRQHAFSEQLVRLGGLGFIFDDPAQTFGLPSSCGGDGRAASSPEVVENREAEEANRPRLYVCAQSLMKMHPAFDAAVAGILAADPLAQILLLRDSRQLLWHSRFRRRLRAAVNAAEQSAVSTFGATAQNGTGPASSPIRGGLWSRVRFVSPLSGREFFRLQCRADVVLDPFPFGGGVTTLEALACGTPVVTAGALQSVHRLAEGLIAAVANTQCQGREDLVARSTTEYIAKAVAVAAPGALKRKVRRALRCGRNGLLHGGGGGGGGGGEDGSDVAADWERFLTNAAAL
ncbi:unnamed protein product, partial [Ectocarpus fasciculatus]